MRSKIARNVFLLVSIGLAIHLILPQIPGIEKSLKLAVGTSHALVFAAFTAELLSELSYAELLGRTVGITSNFGTSRHIRNRRGLGTWFMWRLTVCGYGAAHVLPGSGAAAAAVTYSALRTKGLDRSKVGLALVEVTAFVYAALGLIFAGSLAYLYANRDLDAAARLGVILALILMIGALLGSYAAYREPYLTRKLLTRFLRLGERLPVRTWSRQRAEEVSKRLISQTREWFRTTHHQILNRPVEGIKLALFALCYWGFDALCLVIMFHAFDVPAGTVELFVAYGVATVAGSLPLTPGGIGVFETTMLAILALLGVGSEAVIPVLGYRLFNFWLPIPLGAILYPTLHWRS